MVHGPINIRITHYVKKKSTPNDSSDVMEHGGDWSHTQPVIMKDTKAFPTSNTGLLITVGFY